MMTKAVLFVGGEYISSTEFYMRKLQETSFVSAADSGAEMLRSLGRHPDLLVGDMDSISETTLDWCRSKGSLILIYPSQKDDTDTKIALQALEERDIAEVEIFGATGLRLDHFMGTLASIYGVRNTLKATIVEDSVEIGMVSKELVSSVELGEIWSLFPFGGQPTMISLKGFKYSLKDAFLEYGNPLGVSNETKESEVQILCKGGTVLYFRWLKKQ
ncbi:thiamine diphosphokinase [Mesotoga sp.]|jgi:thiamine pyrophosphokinase|uniref:thiamine diphosphokinase n=1 Tax=Mesotoga sp. TaxID=2053577 RepID=UPI00345F14C5